MGVGKFRHSYQCLNRSKSGELRGQCWLVSRAGYKQNWVGFF